MEGAVVSCHNVLEKVHKWGKASEEGEGGREGGIRGAAKSYQHELTENCKKMGVGGAVIRCHELPGNGRNGDRGGAAGS